MTIRWLRPHATPTAVLAIGALLTVAGCPPVTEPTGSTEPVTFLDDVFPIFQARCIGCHHEGGSSGITLELTHETGYDLLVDQSSVLDPTLTLVVPSDAGASLLFLKVSTDTPPVGIRMPLLLDPLTAAEIDLIRDWIDQGALRD